MTDAWDVWRDERPRGDGFWGYHTWKSDVGPWPSTGDCARPTNPHPRKGFWEDAVVDLTEGEADPVPDPEPDPVLDLVDEVIDLVDDGDDVDDRTR